MAKFRAYMIRGVSAYYENGLIVNISEGYLEIRKVSEFQLKEYLKLLSKEYEISEEQFNSEFKKLLEEFPEVKEVINV